MPLLAVVVTVLAEAETLGDAMQTAEYTRQAAGQYILTSPADIQAKDLVMQIYWGAGRVEAGFNL